MNNNQCRGDTNIRIVKAIHKAFDAEIKGETFAYQRVESANPAIHYGKTHQRIAIHV